MMDFRSYFSTEQENSPNGYNINGLNSTSQSSDRVSYLNHWDKNCGYCWLNHTKSMSMSFFSVGFRCAILLTHNRDTHTQAHTFTHADHNHHRHHCRLINVHRTKAVIFIQFWSLEAEQTEMKWERMKLTSSLIVWLGIFIDEQHRDSEPKKKTWEKRNETKTACMKYLHSSQLVQSHLSHSHKRKKQQQRKMHGRQSGRWYCSEAIESI